MEKDQGKIRLNMRVNESMNLSIEMLKYILAIFRNDDYVFNSIALRLLINIWSNQRASEL